MVSKTLLGYEEALWPKTFEMSHARQILTNARQIASIKKYPVKAQQIQENFKKLIRNDFTPFFIGIYFISSD